jgi:hypothetical protein
MKLAQTILSELANGGLAVAPASWSAPVLWRFSRAGRKAAEGCRSPKPRGISGAASGSSLRDTNSGGFSVNGLFTGFCASAQGVRHVAQGIRHAAQGVQSPAQRIRRPARGVRRVAQDGRRLAQGVQCPAQGIRWPAQGARRVARGVRSPAQGSRWFAQGGKMAAQIIHDRGAWAFPSGASGVSREFSRRECGPGVN